MLEVMGKDKGKGKGSGGSGDGGGSDSDGSGSGGGGGGGCGSGVLLTTADLQRTLTMLLAWGDRNGVRLRNLNARSASLEEVFLAVARSEFAVDGSGGSLPGEVDQPGRQARPDAAAA
ncbi:hypothetical protein Franean1_6812 [Parafrankia sp. EAN1pec]|uniref:hypothetical protein n=1 Tax=Parafrankia sp. (strain EAN1pec) TaxID=298653 RepID=UPI00005431CD|nr:hypothetical protein Franean1_6812 [Frankia sp. EAN1pec]